MENINQQDDNPSWLQRLKNESWEAEILVSAVAIYAIFKSFSAFNWICDLFINKLDPSQYNIGYMITVLGFLAFGILGALFVIHFGLRAYWIGLVGLNSVFPDYSIEDTAYSKKFTEKMMRKLPRLQNSIKNLDEICSVIFSVAFTLLLVYCYLGLFGSVYLLLYNLLSDYVVTYILQIPLAFVAVVYINLTITSVIANIKRFKENDSIQNWYYKSTMWGSVILYGPLYKNLLQVTMIFGSNFKKKKALVRTMIFMIVFGAALGLYKLTESNYIHLLGFSKNEDKSRIYNFYYSNNNLQKSLLLAPEIETEFIKSKSSKLFIPIFDHEISKYEKHCGLDKLPTSNEEQKSEGRQAYLNCYEQNHAIFIDEKPISSKFFKADHSVTGQFGIQTFIDLSEFKNGNHTLKIVKQNKTDDGKTWTIPFYKSN
jgi:hypothetical protein